MNVIIIGGGPAGMIAGISAARNGDKVTIIEKMNSCGKKLLITGKGRCNITNSTDMNGFIENTPCNGRFLYSALNNFDNNDIIELLEKEGVKTKVERGGRIFPISDKSQDVLNALLKILRDLNVQILTNTEVKKIIVKDGQVVGVKIKDVGVDAHIDPQLNADKIILATGGKSYPVTGSTGDGYKLAKELGHTITELKPSLIPLTSKDEECRKLQGLSLRNVEAKLKNDDKIIYQDFGEMLFTHYGVSGPVILSSSAHLIRYKNVDELLKNGNIKLEIDLKPALSEEKLDLRILRDFEEVKNKEFKNSLDKLLPQKLIPVVIEKTKINPFKRVNEITKEERMKIIKVLKYFNITINGVRPIEEAIITSGGISIKEINPKTMESKIIKGLYFAGEIIDVDAYTGGFNLQIAWCTRLCCGVKLIANIVGAGLAPPENKIFNYNTGRPRPTPTEFKMNFIFNQNLEYKL